MEISSQARLVLFLVFLVAFAVLEARFPRRDLTLDRARRWISNLGIVVISTILVRVLIPFAPAGTAFWAQSSGIGLFNIFGISPLIAGLLSFLVLDATIYWQHRLFHQVPILWRVHRMHHTDVDIDVTSGLRFHPIEIILSSLLKMAIVALLGAPVAAVVVFEVVLNGTALFNHARLGIPAPVDRVLRTFVVTPDMHRVHHSIHPDETDSNFGFNLPWWDRLFGTYTAQPRDGHDSMMLGLPYFRGDASVGLVTLLAQPFLSPDGARGAAKQSGDSDN